MRKQKIILYLVALVCFMVCFIVLNRKYDSFYRISGINNETRQLIINNLTEEEQEYLIENSFPTKRFLRFLTHPDFHLHDLEYYEKIEKQTELSIDGVVEYTNSLLEKIRSEEIRNVNSVFQKLTDTSLADLYLVSEDFDLELLNLYHHFATLNQGIDLYAVNQINALATAMNLEGMDEKEEMDFLDQWLEFYDIEDLLMYYELKQDRPDLELVANPQSLTTVILDNQTIASYVPNPLVITDDIARMRFGTYLRQDANAALEEMANAVSMAIDDENLLLIDGYCSYSNLDEKDWSHREYQLGLTIDVMVMGVNYSDFETTKISHYLQAHSWEYGFILRYGDEQSERYSANTYRFVGKEAAKVIHENKLTLEAYEGIKDE